jgi:hypothetical protein
MKIFFDDQLKLGKVNIIFNTIILDLIDNQVLKRIHVIVHLQRGGWTNVIITIEYWCVIALCLYNLEKKKTLWKKISF